MKRTLIITLLLLVAAFSFGQTNATFNNLDVRNTTKLRGLIYPFGAVATSPINTAVHEVAMINNTTFALCRMDFEEFADSIANHLNPIIGTHWYTVPPDTIKTIYNVVVDSSFVMKYKSNYIGYGDPFIGEDSIVTVSGFVNNTFFSSNQTGILNSVPTVNLAAVKNTNSSNLLIVPNFIEVTSDSIVIYANTTIYDDLNYGDTYWKDATVSGLNLAGGVQSPTITQILSTGIYAQGFNHQTANDIAYGSVQFNHDYKLGTDVEAHVHWSINTSPASGSDTVYIAFTYAWADINEAIPSATTVNIKIPTYSASGGGYHRLTELVPAITGNGGDGLSSVLFFKIERLQNSSSDTYAEWWLLHDIDFHYQIDSPGSDSETTK